MNTWVQKEWWRIYVLESESPTDQLIDLCETADFSNNNNNNNNGISIFASVKSATKVFIENASVIPIILLHTHTCTNSVSLDTNFNDNNLISSSKYC